MGHASRDNARADFIFADRNPLRQQAEPQPTKHSAKRATIVGLIQPLDEPSNAHTWARRDPGAGYRVESRKHTNCTHCIRWPMRSQDVLKYTVSHPKCQAGWAFRRATGNQPGPVIGASFLACSRDRWQVASLWLREKRGAFSKYLRGTAFSAGTAGRH